MSNNDKTTSVTILISQDQTIVGDTVLHPDCISILLPNGRAYNIEDTIAILQQHDKKRPSRLRIKARFGRFATAFKKAMDEPLDSPVEQTKS